VSPVAPVGFDGPMRARLAWILAAVLVLALGVGGGLWWWRQQAAERDAAARAAVEAYASAWDDEDLSDVAFADDGAADDFSAAVKGLGDASVSASAQEVTREDGEARGLIDVTWVLPGEVEWSYTVPVVLEERQEQWLVRGPSGGTSWAPDLAAGQTMALERTAPARGDLLDREGEPLMPQGAVFVVQLDPVQATPESAAELEAVTGVDGLVEALAERTSATSQAPVPVITYRESDYRDREQRLDDIPGAYVTESTQPLASTRTFGQPLLGAYGEVTKEIVDAGDGRYVAGDRAGLSGLQRQYDPALAGAPGIAVVTDADAILFEQAPTDGSDVETTLDQTVQAAAERALADADTDNPSALVALDVPSGEVLAVANTPTSGFDRALTGRYPPGSTFKVATTYAYLTEGITTPDAVVPCPRTVTVDGRAFRNYEDASIPGRPTFFEDFTQSCNTAFVSLSPELGDDDLRTAASALGIGADWGDTLGVAGAFPGSIPTTTGGTDTAAAAIGQARDEVSPLSLAVMTGSIGRGTYVAPVLVRTDETPAPRPEPLDGRVVAQIRSMMASVVSSGTATELRGTPGGPVRAKTGTAQHGDDTEDDYVWVTGYQGDVAFAVLIEGGTSGGTDAAPVAKAFLTALAG
jgi:cell division protein FtsI/penicillin-binding protein 2